MNRSVHLAKTIQDRSVHVNYNSSTDQDDREAMTHAKKELLVATASKLFNAHGYQRAGVDMIMKESGISKTTMYKYFPTKEDLILEVLNRKSEALIENITLRVSDISENNPKKIIDKKIAALLDVIEEWIKSKEFCGCLFMKAVSEYDGKDQKIRFFAKKHKEKVKGVIKNILTQNAINDLGDSDERAQNIALVIDGAIITAHIKNDKNIMDNARGIIKTLCF